MTFAFGGQHSIQLSYGRIRKAADDTTGLPLSALLSLLVAVKIRQLIFQSPRIGRGVSPKAVLSRTYFGVLSG